MDHPFTRLTPHPLCYMPIDLLLILLKGCLRLNLCLGGTCVYGDHAFPSPCPSGGAGALPIDHKASMTVLN